MQHGASIANDTSITFTGINTFGQFAVSSEETLLPVELQKFAAAPKAETVLLQWETATEVNSFSFDIERRTSSGQLWTKVGSVAAAGNSNSPKDYAFTDRAGTFGKFVYRLRQIDRTGASAYLRK